MSAAVLLFCLAVPLGAASDIVGARYEGETNRYPHGVLGDEIEYTTLVVELADGREISATWEALLVFEDIAPRLWDLDGDGEVEIVTVESHETKGARLSVWEAETDGLRIVARTPHIGERFRWLAPIGAADLDADGVMEIAFVDRPHLSQTVRIWRWNPDAEGGLEEVAALGGFSNHRIGWPFIVGGLRRCGAGPELILARGDWSRVAALRLTADGLAAEDLAPYSPTAIQRALACEGR